MSKKKLKVIELEVVIYKENKEDYISLTDMAAIRSLNIPQFKQQMAKDIHEMKEGLIKDDGEIRNK